jgi:hypothetical protein
MDADRRPDRISVLPAFNPVLSWEHFDSLFEAPAFDGNSETESEVVNVDTTPGCQQGLFAEDPKMAAATGLFEGGLHPVLP